jgi:hypothetical protein
VGRIGVVFEHLRNDGAPDQGLGRILDRLFGPFIKVVIFDAVGLGLADVIGESIELAFS